MIEQTGYMLVVGFEITGEELAAVTEPAATPRAAASSALKHDAEAICAGMQVICPALGSCALSYFIKVHTAPGSRDVDKLSGGFICNRQPQCLDPELAVASLNRLRREFGRRQ
jgi:hypothetical protein